MCASFGVVGAVSYYNDGGGNPADKVVVNPLSATGNTDIIPSVNIAVWSLTAEVPEPASFSLAALALGLAGITGRSRRRQPALRVSAGSAL